ncbi:hypothetical protein ROJ8625_02360 [Roseivivax jejudonensis]|uniref:DUF995 domain-containing protein n=1 Tax=Roseivivax jejudonensis TaxID=1529041 RepID=A0A1X6ZE59_9RHOB|nr:hypothetical protein [Roseivivax jejudonensis]SLN48469.1 hypothetical protein ROJ8625_02360 [Roseivivax jejudonensis]
MIRALLVLVALAAPAAAADPDPAGGALSAAEFEAYTQGKTLYFGQNGTAYGVERYLPDRRVVWSFLDGDCKEGRWYESGDQICFVYEDSDAPQCWSFFRAPGGGLRAVFRNDPSQTTLYEARQDEEPMVCTGPRVGA